MHMPIPFAPQSLFIFKCLMIDINYIKAHHLILFEAISGSKAYGLDGPNSDTDIRGVFILPKTEFYKQNYMAQVSDEKNDVVYYEIGRFVELLLKGNPTIIELINSPEDCIQIKHPLMDLFKPEDYLTKQCEARFGGYAMSQIKKAKGLNKKIHNPVEKERKTVLDFCYVVHNNNTVPVKKYLNIQEIAQADCGLVKMAHMKDVYGLYHDQGSNYKGIVQSTSSNDISLSSVPKGKQQKTILYFNKDGYSFYCKSYKEYWEWVEKRNDIRYANTVSHGKNYDAKNMMHTFRLLRMAKEIALEGKVHVRRNDRTFLLAIKAGKLDYDELLKRANQLMDEIKVAFSTAQLPATPNQSVLEDISIKIRTHFYE